MAGVQETDMDLENQARHVRGGASAHCLDFDKIVVALHRLTHLHEFPIAETFQRAADYLATCVAGGGEPIGCVGARSLFSGSTQD